MPLSLNSSLLSRSALQSSSRLWGLVLACGLAALAGSRGGTGSTTTPTPLVFPAHTCLCVSPRWGHFQEDRWGLRGARQRSMVRNELFR